MATDQPLHLIINGELVPYENGTMHVTTDAWLRGANLFEGLRSYWVPSICGYRTVDLGSHIDRLHSGLKALYLDAPITKTEVLDSLCKLTRTFREGVDLYVRLSVYIESGAYSEHNVKHGWCLAARPQSSSSGLLVPAEAIVSTWRKYSHASFPANVKAGAMYLLGRLPRIEAERASAQEAILLNEEGNVCETPGANVVLIKNGTLYTPRVADGALNGVTLRCIAGLARRFGHQMVCCTISPNDLFGAEELFTCGTMSEIVPLVRVNQRCIGSGQIGQLTAKLAIAYYKAIVYEREPLPEVPFDEY